MNNNISRLLFAIIESHRDTDERNSANAALYQLLKGRSVPTNVLDKIHRLLIECHSPNATSCIVETTLEYELQNALTSMDFIKFLQELEFACM